MADEPGIVRTQVGTFDLRRGSPADLPAELRVSPHAEALGSQYFIVVPKPDAMRDGGFYPYRDAIVSAGGAFVSEWGTGAYLVRLNPAARGALAGHSGTLVLEPYHPAFKLAPASAVRRSPPRRTPCRTSTRW